MSQHVESFQASVLTDVENYEISPHLSCVVCDVENVALFATVMLLCCKFGLVTIYKLFSLKVPRI